MKNSQKIDRECIQCGEYESDIKKYSWSCALMSQATEDSPSEPYNEYSRHRYSKK